MQHEAAAMPVAPARSVGLLVLGGWEGLVRHYGVPRYLLPGPVAIWQALAADWPLLAGSLLVTLRITLLALLLAVASAALLAVPSRSRAGWSWPSSPMRWCCR